MPRSPPALRRSVAVAHTARQAAAKSIDQGWSNPQRKLQLISAAVAVRDTSRALQIADAVNDADFAVAQNARNAVRSRD